MRLSLLRRQSEDVDLKLRGHFFFIQVRTDSNKQSLVSQWGKQKWVIKS